MHDLAPPVLKSRMKILVGRMLQPMGDRDREREREREAE